MERTVIEEKSPNMVGGSGRSKIWTRSFILLAIAVFLFGLGIGLQMGLNTNYIQELGLSDSQVLLQAGIREIPGLFLVFIAALLTRLSLTWRSVVAMLVMGVGYALYATVHSWSALVAVSLTASIGLHLWLPLNNALGLSLSKKENAGKTLGTLSSIMALASMAGIGFIIILSNWVSLRILVGFAGALIIAAAVVLTRLPKNIGETKKAQQPLLFKRRYWLYYVLLVFEGSRTQVFSAFNTMVLVYNYGWSALQISLLLLISGLVNFLLAQRIGKLLDKFGERITLTIGYIALALCFVGYATINNIWLLGLMVIFINLLVTLSMGLYTYVNRITPPEELTPTLNTGVSFNHITSAGMSIVAGVLLPVVGYKAECWAAVLIILLSVPFALAIRTYVT
jgi:predicted MFS family arabinose efflux permease